MLLAIDIGNTNISLGIFKGRRLLKRAAISTCTADYSPHLKRVLGQYKIEDVIVCSVVPFATTRVKEILRRLLPRGHTYIIGKDIKVPLKNHYRQPGQAGADRLVNAYVGIRLYGAPLIVVDLGTAITFDIVSRDKEYLGGMILPGLSLCLDALSGRTALLPKVKLAQPREFIGRDSKSNMLSGVVYGFSALIDGLVTRIKDQIGKGAKVIGTGGDIGLISKYCKGFDKIDRDLTLKGLGLVYEELREVLFTTNLVTVLRRV